MQIITNDSAQYSSEWKVQNYQQIVTSIKLEIMSWKGLCSLDQIQEMQYKITSETTFGK